MSFDKRKTLQSALLYTQQGKWDRAIAEYEAVVKADPADLSICNNLGDLYARAGRMGEAIEQYRKLGESYRNDGLSVKAIAVYKKIAKLDPEWTAAYQVCAELYLEQGLVGEAKLQLTTAAQQYAKAGDTKKVLEISQRMAQLDPGNVPLLSKLAELLVTEGQPEAAATEFERAAKASEAAGHAAEAKRLLKRARELMPAANQPSLAAAEALIGEGKAAEAAAMLEPLVAQGEQPRGWQRLGEAYGALGRPAEAAAAFEQAVAQGVPEGEVAGVLSQAWLDAGQTAKAAAVAERLAQAALARGKAEEALGYCRSLVTAAPTLLAGHERLVQVLESLGRETEALAARHALAAAHQAGGDSAGAVATYREILRRDPADAEAQAQLLVLEGPAVVPGVTAEAGPAAEAAPDGDADLTGLELLLEEPDGPPTAFAEPAPAPLGDESPDMMAMPELLELQELHVPRSDLPIGPPPPEPAREAPPAVQLPEPLFAPGPAQSPAPASPAPPLVPPSARGAEEASPQAEQWTPEPAVTEEDASLAFLGDSLGLGSRDLEEEEAAAGPAAEQLAEAEVYLKYGLEEKARERLRDVIKLSPNSVTARRKLKTLYQQQHLIDEACGQVVAIAQILEGRRRHEAALEEVREGLALAPEHPDLLRLLAAPPAAPAPPRPPEAPAIRQTAQPPEARPVEVAPQSSEPLSVDLESLLSPALGLDEAEPVFQQADPSESAADLEILELPEVAELPDIPDLVLSAGSPREDVPGAASAEALLPPPEDAAEAPVQAQAAAALAHSSDQEAGLPPELQALLEEPSDSLLLGSSADAEESGVTEELAEAEFYLGQGMAEEAQAVCRRLQATHPGHPAVAALVTKLAEHQAAAGPFGALMFAPPEGEAVPQASVPAPAPAPAVADDASLEDLVPQFRVQDAAAPTGERAFVNLGAELAEELDIEDHADADRVGGPLVDGLLKEFQRGVREQVDDKDFETHYNLGIAYKEMDLYDEAIQEFRLSGRDPKRALESADLLGLCFLAKGQGPQAVTELQAGLALSGHPAEAYRSLRYDLGMVHETLGQAAEALQHFEALQKEDPRFRDVQSRLQSLRAQLPPKAAVRPAPAPVPGPPTRPQPPKGTTRKISFI